jgi:hypothetical protein
MPYMSSSRPILSYVRRDCGLLVRLPYQVVVVNKLSPLRDVTIDVTDVLLPADDSALGGEVLVPNGPRNQVLHVRELPRCSCAYDQQLLSTRTRVNNEALQRRRRSYPQPELAL